MDYVGGTIVMACGMGMAMSRHQLHLGAVPVSKAGVGSATNDTHARDRGALGVAVWHGVERRLSQPGNALRDQLDPGLRLRSTASGATKWPGRCGQGVNAIAG